MINNILQNGGYPLYPPGMELPVELTIRIFDFLTIQQLLLLLDNNDTRPSVINVIKSRLLHSKLNIDELKLLYNQELFRKIIIIFIIKELSKPSVSLYFVQNVYIHIDNYGVKNKINKMINDLYSSIFDIPPDRIINYYTELPIDELVIKIAYIRIYRIITIFLEKYPQGIIGKESFQNTPGVSYKFNITFTKMDSDNPIIKTYIIEPGYSNTDCNISTPDYIWQVLENCTFFILYEKLIRLVNSSFEYDYNLGKIQFMQVTHTINRNPDTGNIESFADSKTINSINV